MARRHAAIQRPDLKGPSLAGSGLSGCGLALRIVVSASGEIDIPKIRALIHQLSNKVGMQFGLGDLRPVPIAGVDQVAQGCRFHGRHIQRRRHDGL